MFRNTIDATSNPGLTDWLSVIQGSAIMPLSLSFPSIRNTILSPRFRLQLKKLHYNLVFPKWQPSQCRFFSNQNSMQHIYPIFQILKLFRNVNFQNFSWYPHYVVYSQFFATKIPKQFIMYQRVFLRNFSILWDYWKKKMFKGFQTAKGSLTPNIRFNWRLGVDSCRGVFRKTVAESSSSW